MDKKGRLMDNLQKKFGARIKEIRRSKNLTQEKLAETIDMDIPNLSNIERGKKFVSSHTLTKIAAALEVQEKDLFDFEHIKKSEDLIKLIVLLVEKSSEAELEYIYKMIINLKQFQKHKSV